MAMAEDDSSSPQKGEPQSKPGPIRTFFTRIEDGYQRFIGAVSGGIAKSMAATGTHVARRPVVAMLLGLVFVGLCAIGLMAFDVENAGDKLWVPQDSKAKHDEKWVEDNFGVSGGYSNWLATVNPGHAAEYGDNVLQLAIFYEAWLVDAAIRNITFEKNGQTWRWEDVCYRNYTGGCDYDGALNFWSMNFQQYLADVGGKPDDPTAGNRDALIEAVNSPTFPNNQSVSTLTIFGGVTLSDSPAGAAEPMYLSGAQVISFAYSLRDDIPDSVETKWYSKFVDVMDEWTDKVQYMEVAYMAGNSVDLEIGRSVTNDMYLIAIAVLIFIMVAVIGMTRGSLVSTRSSLGLIGVLSAALALLAGYSLAFAFGCPFTTLQQTLPYILLGLAVDCMFILAKAYDNVVEGEAKLGGPPLTLPERFAKLMRSAGTSVGITLLASAVAFALGGVSALPSIAWFSAFATLSVVCLLVVILFFFLPVFVLTERRIQANRFDCLCCMKRTSKGASRSTSAADAAIPTAVPVAIRLDPVTLKPLDPVAKQAVAPMEVVVVSGSPERPSSPSAAAGATQESADGTAPGAKVRKGGLVKRFFEKIYTPFLSKWWGKSIVIALFVGWVVVCGVGIPQLEEGQPMSELAPNDSYLQDYVKVQDETFSKQVGSPTNLYFRDFDPSPPSEQAKMLLALDDALHSSYINATLSAFQGNWLLSFIGWVGSEHPEVALAKVDGCINPFVGATSGDLALFVDPKPIGGCVPQDQFYGLLAEFLSQNVGYKDDMLWTGASAGQGTIRASRMSLIHRAENGEGAYGRKSLESVRDVEHQVNSELFADVHAQYKEDAFFMYNGNYIYGEGDAILGEMTMEYILLAVLGVGVVLALTLPSPRAVLFMMIAVGLVDLFLFGEMFILGIRFNQVSVINMVMATGLAVDYSVYFAQRFVMVEADGTRDGRMMQALVDTGSAVCVGGLTALLGTIPLAFSSSTILVTFFALLFGTIIFSMLVGLMLMPVVFSLIGPPAYKKPRSKDASQHQGHQKRASGEDASSVSSRSHSHTGTGHSGSAPASPPLPGGIDVEAPAPLPATSASPKHVQGGGKAGVELTSQ